LEGIRNGTKLQNPGFRIPPERYTRRIGSLILCRPFAVASWREKTCTGNAQGIEAVSFFAGGKKDTSGKPGPGAVLPCGQVGARMRPE
jgi:hypothetical protein